MKKRSIQRKKSSPGTSNFDYERKSAENLSTSKIETRAYFRLSRSKSRVQRAPLDIRLFSFAYLYLSVTIE